MKLHERLITAVESAIHSFSNSMLQTRPSLRPPRVLMRAAWFRPHGVEVPPYMTIGDVIDQGLPDRDPQWFPRWCKCTENEHDAGCHYANRDDR